MRFSLSLEKTIRVVRACLILLRHHSSRLERNVSFFDSYVMIYDVTIDSLNHSICEVLVMTIIIWIYIQLFYVHEFLLPSSLNSTHCRSSIFNIISCTHTHTYFFSCDQAALWMVFSVRPSVRLSVCPSVRLSHLFYYVPIIVSSWKFQELSPRTRVRSMQKVKVRGQRSRSQRSRPN